MNGIPEEGALQGGGASLWGRGRVLVMRRWRRVLPELGGLCRAAESSAEGQRTVWAGDMDGTWKGHPQITRAVILPTYTALAPPFHGEVAAEEELESRPRVPGFRSPNTVEPGRDHQPLGSQVDPFSAPMLTR